MAISIHRKEIYVSSTCPAGLSGPSGTLSYAVGLVAHILQLQAKDRGFQVETSVSTQQVSTWATAFHNEAEPKLCPLHHRTVRPCRQKACSNLKGAA